MVFEERARDEKFADVKNARILVGGRMIQRQTMKLTLPIATIALLLAGCEAGGESKSSFDKTLTVSGPIKLDLSNASGTVRITGSSDNKVHIHGDIQSHGMFFNDPDKQARELSANPPIEQKPDVIRVGRDVKRYVGVSIDYTIEVPRNSEVSTSVASGSQTISDLQGPVKVESASGSISVSKIEKSVQVNSASSSITAQDLGDDFHASSASGSVTATNVKGDVRIHAISGSMEIAAP